MSEACDAAAAEVLRRRMGDYWKEYEKKRGKKGPVKQSREDGLSEKDKLAAWRAELLHRKQNALVFDRGISQGEAWRRAAETMNRENIRVYALEKRSVLLNGQWPRGRLRKLRPVRRASIRLRSGSG